MLFIPLKLVDEIFDNRNSEDHRLKLIEEELNNLHTIALLRLLGSAKIITSPDDVDEQFIAHAIEHVTRMEPLHYLADLFFTPSEKHLPPPEVLKEVIDSGGAVKFASAIVNLLDYGILLDDQFAQTTLTVLCRHDHNIALGLVKALDFLRVHDWLLLNSEKTADIAQWVLSQQMRENPSQHLVLSLLDRMNEDPGLMDQCCRTADVLSEQGSGSPYLETIDDFASLAKETPFGEVKRTVAQSLGNMSLGIAIHTTIDTLVTLMRGDDDYPDDVSPRIDAAKVLGELQLSTHKVVECLISGLWDNLENDGDEEFPATCARSLGQLCAPDPRIQAGLFIATQIYPAQGLICQAASVALRKVEISGSLNHAASIAAVSILVDLYKRENVRFEIFIAIVITIGRVGLWTPEAEEVLLRATQHDYDTELRLAALEALSKLGKCSSAGQNRLFDLTFDFVDSNNEFNELIPSQTIHTMGELDHLEPKSISVLLLALGNPQVSSDARNVLLKLKFEFRSIDCLTHLLTKGTADTHEIEYAQLHFGEPIEILVRVLQNAATNHYSIIDTSIPKVLMHLAPHAPGTIRLFKNLLASKESTNAAKCDVLQVLGDMGKNRPDIIAVILDLLRVEIEVAQRPSRELHQALGHTLTRLGVDAPTVATVSSLFKGQKVNAQDLAAACQANEVPLKLLLSKLIGDLSMGNFEQERPFACVIGKLASHFTDFNADIILCLETSDIRIRNAARLALQCARGE